MAPASNVSWKVLYQQETVGRSVSGVFGKGVEITFQTGSGLIGSVFVPRDQYRPDLSKAMIAAAAANLEEHQKLTS